MAMILEEGGYAAMPGPFLFSSVLAASALKLGGSKELNSNGLPRSPRGRLLAPSQSLRAQAVSSRLILRPSPRRNGAGWRLSGVKMLVPYANVADFIVVAAQK